MGTEHNDVWAEILASTVSKNFEAIYAGGMTVDNGEGAPPGAFEPWMRTEIGCWGDVVDGKRVAYMRFRAGTEEDPFQETLVTVSEEAMNIVAIAHTKPNDEFRFCEIVSHMIHLIIHQRASIAGKPGCCCPDEPNGAEHIHPEFVVPNVVIEEGSNIEVLKPSNIGRGLTNIVPDYLLMEKLEDGVVREVVPVANNVTPLRAVKNDEPSKS